MGYNQWSERGLFPPLKPNTLDFTWPSTFPTPDRNIYHNFQIKKYDVQVHP